MGYVFDKTKTQFLSTLSPISNSPFTICSRVSATGNNGVFAVAQASGNYSILYMVSSGETDSFRADNFYSSSASINSTSFSREDKWRSAGLVEAAFNEHKAFTDGLVNTSNATISQSNRNLMQMTIGRDSTFYNSYLTGKVAEFAVWSAALTDAEIASLAKGFKPTRIRPQSLVFYAPLLRNLQDIKGGLALTNNNGATVADHPRVY